MGYLLSLLMVAALIGFNVFAVDALIKMRADIVVIRKQVSTMSSAAAKT